MATTITKHGETWDIISYRVYGDEHHVKKLIDANRNQRAVRIFSAGVRLAVPELTADELSASTLPPWKR